MDDSTSKKFVTKRLDMSGLRCPLPLLKACKALEELSAGQWLEVLLSDPGSKNDLVTFAEQSAIRIEFFETETGKFRLRLQRGIDRD